MAFKQIMAACAIVLACLVANASAFVAPMTTVRAPSASARSTASGMSTANTRTHACGSALSLPSPVGRKTGCERDRHGEV